MMPSKAPLFMLVALLTATSSAAAQPESAATSQAAAGPRAPSQAAAGPPAAAAKPAKAPYSLPWQLRPAGVGNVIRWDTAVAAYKPRGSATGGDSIASFLLLSYKITDDMAPLVRLGVLNDNSPGDSSKTGLTNAAVGFTWAPRISTDLRFAAFLGVAFPIASGGGNQPSASAPSPGRGIYARSAMDNAMFAVNDVTVFPGLDLAYVAHGLTVQGEVTVLQLSRVRGDKVQKDSAKTNFTSGLHVGYFIIPELSLGAEIRYQRWLSTPSFVKADEALPDAQQTGVRDCMSFAVGPRLHFRITDHVRINPGIAYARGIDDPMSRDNYNVVQVDVPVSF